MNKDFELVMSWMIEKRYGEHRKNEPLNVSLDIHTLVFSTSRYSDQAVIIITHARFESYRDHLQQGLLPAFPPSQCPQC